VARLPIPGSDNGSWGTVLNDYLAQSHKSDGTLKDNSVTSGTLAPGSVTNAAIATDAVNATSIADGSVTEALLATNRQLLCLRINLFTRCSSLQYEKSAHDKDD